MARPKVEQGKKCVRQDISIHPDLLNRVTEYCQKEDRSISWVIKKALESYLVV